MTSAPSPDEDGDAAGVPGQAGVVEDDRGLGEVADLDDQLAPHDLVRAGAGQAERDGAVQLRLGRDADDRGAAAALPGERGEPVGRLGQALEQRVVGVDRGQLDALGQVGHPGQVRIGRGAVQERTDPLHGREAPGLLAARGHAEGVRVGRGEPLGRRPGGRRSAVRVRARGRLPGGAGAGAGWSGPARPRRGAKSSPARSAESVVRSVVLVVSELISRRHLPSAVR